MTFAERNNRARAYSRRCRRKEARVQRRVNRFGHGVFAGSLLFFLWAVSLAQTVTLALR